MPDTSTAPETVGFDEDSYPLMAVVFMEPDDEAWWKAVAAHAIDFEWLYGIDLTAEPVTQPDSGYYDDALVLAWVKRHVDPPKWMWHGEVHNPDHTHEEDCDDECIVLDPSPEPRDGYRRGAVISLREEPTS